MATSAFLHLLSSSSSGAASSMMEQAWRQAVRGIGRTRPNPPVGCVVATDDGRVLGVGHHARAGDRHAEVVALDDVVARHGAGAARGQTLHVTLEPCTHHGRTPPCVDRILHEGIGRVVVGALDPNPRVHGGGVERLRAAGVVVDVVRAASPPRAVDFAGCDVDDATRCRAMLQPFASTMTRQRPWVVLKTATSLDGRVATRTGASRFITGDASRSLVHALRDAVDAVVVGASTVRIDDPALTVRDAPSGPDARRDPLRVVLDRRAEVAPGARVFAPPGALVLHDPATTWTPPPGVEGVACGTDPPGVLAELGRRGVLAVLVEAGPRLAASFLRAGAVDELWWFHAPIVVGGDGVAAVGSLDVEVLTQALSFVPAHRAVLGTDTLTVLMPTPSGSDGALAHRDG
jgi:diaminohydroxyphosphoribosylaminopyrimidine deaminase/5-amino-6-(5-phosphoribosylamino)uracil reductase